MDHAKQWGERVEAIAAALGCDRFAAILESPIVEACGGPLVFLSRIVADTESQPEGIRAPFAGMLLCQRAGSKVTPEQLAAYDAAVRVEAEAQGAERDEAAPAPVEKPPRAARKKPRSEG